MLRAMRSRGILVLALAAAGTVTGCSRKAARNLDLDLIRVTTDARMRTDTVTPVPAMSAGATAGQAAQVDWKDDARYAQQATFVLVDAENTATEGAYVTLAGELTAEGGAVVGHLQPQSLWIPAGGRRTYALVDSERAPRPGSTSARVVVRGALIPDSPPPASIEELHLFDDHGKAVAQAYLVNHAERAGQIVVLAAFHGADGRPMTRPYQTFVVGPQTRISVQFVGPAGSTTGTIFVGDVVY